MAPIPPNPLAAAGAAPPQEVLNGVGNPIERLPLELIVMILESIPNPTGEELIQLGLTSKKFMNLAKQTEEIFQKEWERVLELPELKCFGLKVLREYLPSNYKRKTPQVFLQLLFNKLKNVLTDTPFPNQSVCNFCFFERWNQFLTENSGPLSLRRAWKGIREDILEIKQMDRRILRTKKEKEAFPQEKAPFETIRKWMSENHPLLQKFENLELDGQKILKIPTELRFFRNLKSLNLNDNPIDTIPDNFFTHFPTLKELKLSNTLLSNPPNLTGLNHLKTLHLDESPIGTAARGALPSDLFQSTPNIVELELKNTDITTLPSGIFNQTKELKHLTLDLNDIEALPDDIFSPLRKIQSISLALNPLSSFLEKLYQERKSLNSKQETLSSNREEELESESEEEALSSQSAEELESETEETPLSIDSEQELMGNTQQDALSPNHQEDLERRKEKIYKRLDDYFFKFNSTKGRNNTQKHLSPLFSCAAEIFPELDNLAKIIAKIPNQDCSIFLLYDETE